MGGPLYFGAPKCCYLSSGWAWLYPIKDVILCACNFRGDALTKADLIEKLYLECEYSKAEATALVEQVLEELKMSLQRGESVKISGFGHFKVKDKAARKGRNPQTGEDITIEGRRIVTFKPSTVLRDMMNGEGLR